MGLHSCKVCLHEAKHGAAVLDRRLRPSQQHYALREAPFRPPRRVTAGAAQDGGRRAARGAAPQAQAPFAARDGAPKLAAAAAAPGRWDDWWVVPGAPPPPEGVRMGAVKRRWRCREGTGWTGLGWTGLWVLWCGAVGGAGEEAGHTEDVRRCLEPRLHGLLALPSVSSSAVR